MNSKLQTALYSALLLVASAVAVGVSVVTFDLHQDLAATHLLLGQFSTSAGQLNQTLAKVDTAVGTLNAAATEERDSWKKTSKETADTARQIRSLVDDLGKSALHVRLTTLPAIDTQITANGDQLQSTIAKLGDTATGVTAVTDTLNMRLEDPRVTELIGHADVITANLEVISNNSAAMSGDMRLAVHRLAQPPSKFHQFLDAAWTAAKFGSLFVP